MGGLKRMSLTSPVSGDDGVLPFRSFSMNEVYSISLGNTSRGNQEKYKTLDGSYYIKTRFVYEQHMWSDHLVEVIASQYAHLCKLPTGMQVVRQGVCKLGTDTCSYSEAFDLDGKSYIAFSRALGDRLKLLSVESRYASELASWFDTIDEFYSSVVGSDQTDYLLTMMLLDTIVANEDSHLSNFGYVTSPVEDCLFPSSLFDFGLGSFEHSTAYYTSMPLERAIRKVTLKPWGFKLSKVLEFLEYHSSLVSSVLPKEVNLGDFTFPSKLAQDYFQWVNERLGVKVVGV